MKEKRFSISFDQLQKYKDLICKYTNKIEKGEKEKGFDCKCGCGCDKCCHDLILVSRDEIEPIAETVKLMPRKQRERVINRALEQEKVLTANGITYERVRKIVFENNTSEILLTKYKYYELNLPCIFLEDHKCMIYDVRPTDCWTYRQYISVDNCETGPGRRGASCHKNTETAFMKELASLFHPEYESVIRFFEPLPLVLTKNMHLS